MRDRFAVLNNRLLFQSALYRRLHQGVSRASYLLLHDLRRRRFPSTLNADQPRQQLAYLGTHPEDEQVYAFRLLRTMARECRDRGATFLVLDVPDEVQLYNRGYDAINARMAAFCHQAGIPLIDVLPRLRADPEREHLFLDGVHLTTRGHRIVADLLFRALQDGGYLQVRAAS